MLTCLAQVSGGRGYLGVKQRRSAHSDDTSAFEDSIAQTFQPKLPPVAGRRIKSCDSGRAGESRSGDLSDE